MNIRVRPRQTDLSRYLRWGRAPERKSENPDDLFVWQTRRDNRVRAEHRSLDGRLLTRREIDEIGWPADQFNCRCDLTPYKLGTSEFVNQDLMTTIVETVRSWNSFDFAYHFRFGNGKTVYLSDVGHLTDVIEHFSFRVGGTGRLRAWAGQIATRAREAGTGSLSHDFRMGYSFESVAFAHGRSDVFGSFSGEVTPRGSMLCIKGETQFRFQDTFTDPADLRQWPFRERDPLPEDWTEFGGTAYLITDTWRMTFLAEVHADPSLSGFNKE